MGQFDQSISTQIQTIITAFSAKEQKQE